MTQILPGLSKAECYHIFKNQLSPLLQILAYPNIVEITRSHVHLLFRQPDHICTKEICRPWGT